MNLNLLIPMAGKVPGLNKQNMRLLNPLLKLIKIICMSM